MDTDTLFNSLSSFALEADRLEVEHVPAYCRKIPPDVAHVVIDVSVNFFFPFCGQMRTHLLPALADGGHNPLIHTVITGGGQRAETYNGFNNLVENFADLPFIVCPLGFVPWRGSRLPRNDLL